MLKMTDNYGTTLKQSTEEINYTEVNNTSDSDISIEAEASYWDTLNKYGRWRCLLAFWLLGLCNNYAYVIMLSAAHDILNPNYSNHSAVISNITNTTRQCNPTSAGAILLADILPSLFIKMVAPFLFTNEHIRSVIVMGLSASSFLLVSFSSADWMTYTGVVCAALSGGFGEVTYLSYSAAFHENVISTWSSGTGASGVIGALSYAFLTSTVVGLTPRTTLQIMIVVPVIMAFSFWLILIHPHNHRCCHKSPDTALLRRHEEPNLTFQEKLCVIPTLLSKYMVPLAVVYFFEYFINQGLMELLEFPEIWLPFEEQYRWLQVDYQVGVFISRSSVNFVTIRNTWMLALLQFVNAVFFLFESIYLFVPSFWIIIVLVFWEGLLGGATYVNTFYRLSQEAPERVKSFSMGIVSLSDALGIAIAGAVAIPVHNVICKLPLHM